MPLSISRPPGSVIKWGGDQSLFFLGGKFQNAQSVSGNRKDEPIETVTAFLSSEQILSESFQGKVYIQNVCCCSCCFDYFHFCNWKHKVPCGSEMCLRCSESDCSVHLPIWRIFYKRNWKFKWKVLFLEIIEGDLLFLKYWMFSAVCNESRQYIKIK